jgi:hypothetical protein
MNWSVVILLLVNGPDISFQHFLFLTFYCCSCCPASLVGCSCLRRERQIFPLVDYYLSQTCLLVFLFTFCRMLQLFSSSVLVLSGRINLSLCSVGSELLNASFIYRMAFPCLLSSVWMLLLRRTLRDIILTLPLLGRQHSVLPWVLFHLQVRLVLRHPMQTSACKRVQNIRFDVSTEVIMKNAAFWYITPCGSSKNRSIGGTYRLHCQGGTNQRARNNVSNKW